MRAVIVDSGGDPGSPADKIQIQPASASVASAPDGVLTRKGSSVPTRTCRDRAAIRGARTDHPAHVAGLPITASDQDRIQEILNFLSNVHGQVAPYPPTNTRAIDAGRWTRRLFDNHVAAKSTNEIYIRWLLSLSGGVTGWNPRPHMSR